MMAASTNGAMKAITRADRSRSRWRRSLPATSRAVRSSLIPAGAIASLLEPRTPISVPQGLAGEVEEHGLQVGLDQLDAGHLGPGVLGRLQQPRQQPATVAGHQLDPAG